MENNKPISIIIEELRNNIILTINNSKLPVCITEMIFKDIYEEIENLKVQELNQDKEKYNQDKSKETKPLKESDK